jgi:MYXO-CTERM domain-containing protein
MTFSNSANRLGCVALIAELCLLAPPALAHGGPAVVIGIVAADANGPSVVLVNEGIGLKRGAHWTFLCPSLWGNTSSMVAKVPLALSADGQTSWIAGEQDLYSLRDGKFESQGRSDLNSSHVELLAGDSRGVFALVLTDTGTEIVRFGDPAPAVIWQSTDYWSSFVLNGDLLQVARMTDDAKSLVLVSVNLTGEVADMKTIARDFPGDTSVDLRPTPKGLFAMMSNGTDRMLVAIENATLRVVTHSMTPILGPQASPDGSLWIVADDKLQQAVADTYAVVDDTHMLTCLGRWNSIPYVCAAGQLFALEDRGLGTLLFDLQGFEGPEPDLVTADAKQYCDFQWILYKNDLMVGNYGPVDAVGEVSAGGDAGAPILGTAGIGALAGTGAATAGASVVLPIAGASGVAGAAATTPATAPAAASGCSVTSPGRDAAISWPLAAAMAAVVARRRRRARAQNQSGFIRA